MKNIIPMLFPILVFSQSGRDIAEMIKNRPAPDDLFNRTVMILTNSKGKTRTHEMISKSKDGGEKQIIWFMEPKDDRGIAFLKIEHENRDNEMRMWLPAFKKVRRISSKKKGDSFMGSDLSYEDLSNRELNDHNYKRLDDETWLGRDCYVLQIIPKKELKSSYTRHVSWIDKNEMTNLKEQSFDKRNKLSGQVEIEARNYFKEKVYKNVIPRNVRLSEAPSHGVPVLLYDKSCPGSISYFSFTDEFINQDKEFESAA